MAIDLTPEQDEVRKKVCADFDFAEERHRPHRLQWERFYRMYRSFREFADVYQTTQPAGRDSVMVDAQDTWGAEMFIPYAFSTVETILPRMLSTRPKMLVMPRNADSGENAPAMRQLIDAQQQQIRYELKLQETAKSGLIYGLGVQKVFWRTETRPLRAMVIGAQGPEPGMVEQGFDDPDAEDVDIFDWFWDPFGSEMENLRYCIHRTWRDGRYCKERIRSGAWQGLSEEDVDSLGPTAKYDEVIDARMTASGVKDWRTRGNQLHEVWEHWDRRDNVVTTLLDRQVPVQQGPNPYWHGQFPFVLFRPTTSAIKQLPGIGEIDPIEDLVLEMNTLRRQRDNAALVLQTVVAYSEGFVEPGDLVFFPGAAIETRGEPRDLLYPLNVGEIPNSGYQEETNLQADIERTTGISDPVSGAGDASQTATGVQLVQSAANVRIAAKTRRLEVETAAAACRLFGGMNQQKIIANREVRIPAPPVPGQAERRWAWVQVGPSQLMGEFDYEADGGSSAPENVAEMRSDGQAFLNSFANNPHVDQRMVMEHALTLFGIKQPGQWVVPDPVPQELPQALVQLGVKPELIQQGIEVAREMEQAQAENPGPQMATAAAEQQQQAQQNGKGG